ncbi:MAG: low molecular weight phosphatase family protein [Pseudomonadota bacterium]
MAQPKAILFACNMNSVRSPMAEALAKTLLGPGAHVESCGVYEGILDPFVARVLEEEGIPIPHRDPQTFAKVDVSQFDHVVALTPEAAAEARRAGAQVTFWETPNPTDIRGPEIEMLAAYRTCRNGLRAKIAEEFGE